MKYTAWPLNDSAAHGQVCAQWGAFAVVMGVAMAFRLEDDPPPPAPSIADRLLSGSLTPGSLQVGVRARVVVVVWCVCVGGGVCGVCVWAGGVWHQTSGLAVPPCSRASMPGPKCATICCGVWLGLTPPLPMTAGADGHVAAHAAHGGGSRYRKGEDSKRRLLIVLM
jgi:hypothetical protein